MPQAGLNPWLQRLAVLVGEWTIEQTHPSYPSTVVQGRAIFEWLEHGAFLIQRSETDHPDFPDSVSVIGGDDTTERFTMLYSDSRGVTRIYEMSLGDGIWRLWRDAPGFTQRFTGTFGEDGTTIDGLWELSSDGAQWERDLAVTYRKAR